MENFLFYLLNGVLRSCTITPLPFKVAGEDAWMIEVSVGGRFVCSWCILRSEIRMIRDHYEERKECMSDSERANFDKLIALL